MHISNDRSRLATWIALPLAVIASGAVIATASYAAFSDSTDNAGNSWSSGKVQISDDDTGVALFDASDLVPGSTGTNCITVTADTTADSTVRFYTASQLDEDGLADHLTMKVERGDLATAGDCSTFASTATDHEGPLSELLSLADFGAGLGSWSTGTTPKSVTYRLTYGLDTDAPNTVQESTAETAFVWEAQSN